MSCVVTPAVKYSPETYVEIGSGEPIESENLMEFRLLYEGELLPCTNSKRRSSEKHAIRRVLHPQLRRLWQVKNNLRQLTYHDPVGADKPSNEQERFDLGIARIGERWSRAGYQLIPLVTAEMALRCSVEILLLRPEEKRLIFEQGDIDGQLKTVFDALKIPLNLDETGGMGPQEDETPFYCLLEDDRLISEVTVKADQLLLLPHERKVKANDAFVVIHVKVNHATPRTFDNYFG